MFGNSLARTALIRAAVSETVNVSASSPSVGARAISSSAVRRGKAKGPVPTFPEEDVLNEQLANFISTLKHEIITPSRVSHKYRRLMYTPSLHKELQLEEGYRIRSGGQEFLLTPRERQESMGGVKALTKAINSMNSPEDYAALPGLLMTWKQSDRLRDLGVARYEMVLRKLRNAGEYLLIRKLFDEAEEIGMRFTKLGVRWAALAFWEEVQEIQPKVTNKGARRLWHIREVLKKLESDKKNKEALKCIVEPKLSEDPVLLGLLMGARAVHCIKLHEGQDKEGNVSSYADEFLAVMKTDPAEDRLPDYSVGPKYHDITIAEEWQAVLDGLRQAQEVLKEDPEKVLLLEEQAQKIEAAVNKWTE